MKRILLATLFTSGFLNIAKAQDFAWAKSFDGNSTATGKSVATDPSGNVYATGFFEGTVDFDPSGAVNSATASGQADIYITKQNSNGDLIWVKTFGSINNDYGQDIVVDASGNVFVTGIFTNTIDFDPLTSAGNYIFYGTADIFVLKLNTAGDYQWSKHIAGSLGNYTNSIDLDPSGNVYLAGYFNGNMDFGIDGTSNILSTNGGEDGFIAKLDPSGTTLWAKNYGSTGSDALNSIVVDASGNTHAIGHFQGTASEYGGGSPMTSSGSSDMMVLKLNTSGTFLWVNKIGFSSIDQGRDIALDANNNVYVIGDITNLFGITVLIGKYTAAGAVSWGGAFDAPTTSDVSRAGGIIIDANHQLYATGYFTGTPDFDISAGSYTETSAGNNDIFVIRMDTSGVLDTVITIGGALDDIGRSITCDANNELYITGHYASSCDFDFTATGTTTLTATSVSDVFVTKWNQTLNNPGLGTNHSDEPMLSVYPNPVDNELYVSINEPSTITIYNLQGQLVFAETFNSSSIVDMSSLPSGVYILQVGNTAAIKLIKK